jgi:hypothetical protein
MRIKAAEKNGNTRHKNTTTIDFFFENFNLTQLMNSKLFIIIFFFTFGAINLLIFAHWRFQFRLASKSQFRALKIKRIKERNEFNYHATLKKIFALCGMCGFSFVFLLLIRIMVCGIAG